MLDAPTLGGRVRQRRESLDISQTELGELTGYSQSSIAEIERGESKQPRRIDQIAAALRTTPAWLRGDDPSDAAPLRLPTGLMDKAVFRAVMAESARALRASDMSPAQMAETLIRLHDELVEEQERARQQRVEAEASPTDDTDDDADDDAEAETGNGA